MTVYISPQAGGNIVEFLPEVITQLYRTTTTTLGDTSSTFLLAAASVGTNKTGWGSLRWTTVR